MTQFDKKITLEQLRFVIGVILDPLVDKATKCHGDDQSYTDERKNASVQLAKLALLMKNIVVSPDDILRNAKLSQALKQMADPVGKSLEGHHFSNVELLIEVLLEEFFDIDI